MCIYVHWSIFMKIIHRTNRHICFMCFMLQPTYLLSKFVSFRIWESQWVLFLLVTETLEKWMRAEVRALGQRDTWGWRRGCAPTSTWCSTWPGRPSMPASPHRCQPGTCQRHFEFLIIRSWWKNFGTHTPHWESLEHQNQHPQYLLCRKTLSITLCWSRWQSSKLQRIPSSSSRSPMLINLKLAIMREMTIIQMMMMIMMMSTITWWGTSRDTWAPQQHHGLVLMVLLLCFGLAAAPKHGKHEGANDD